VARRRPPGAVGEGDLHSGAEDRYFPSFRQLPIHRALCWQSWYTIQRHAQVGKKSTKPPPLQNYVRIRITNTIHKYGILSPKGDLLVVPKTQEVVCEHRCPRIQRELERRAFKTKIEFV